MVPLGAYASTPHEPFDSPSFHIRWYARHFERVTPFRSGVSGASVSR
ncbi:hypothetical protein CYFUS_007923 [Cystobacter fuscus]|uniref:Uncharacterized protein n=1 Tax=Cystobacter fuscus TaxID=43 RepID=A0A250JEX1_9BACT|nr:hypothetical protein CYFUS_007923 [Cystobacter fuscus]